MTIDAIIKKGQKDSPIINWLKDDERVLNTALQVKMQEKSLGDFQNRLKVIQIYDGSITEKDAFNQCAKEFNIENDENSIILLAAEKASDEIIQYCYDCNHAQSLSRDSNQNQNVELNQNQYWLGSEETEFVQLLYALVESKRLKKKGKVKMVQKIASFLGFHLSYDWQSKLSHAIHDTNEDKIPSIFDELKYGWLSYRSDQIEKRKITIRCYLPKVNTLIIVSTRYCNITFLMHLLFLLSIT